MKNITVRKIVDDTYSNSSGYQLFIKLDEALSHDKSLNISFKNISPASSSFLNSSFGELIDKYGFDKIKKLIHFSDLSPTFAAYLKRYFSTYEKTSH